MGQPQDRPEWKADQGSPRAAGGTLQGLASEPDRERSSVFRQRWKVEEKDGGRSRGKEVRKRRARSVEVKRMGFAAD